MSKLQVTDMLARAFGGEGVDTLFTLCLLYTSDAADE